MNYPAVTNDCLHFIENLEGCRLHAYKDTRGIWTIGVGMTTLYGRAVKPTDVITQEQADTMFRFKVQYFQDQIHALVKIPLTANQLTALTSLAYNIGLAAFSTSQVVRCLDKKDYKGAADAFLNWTRAGNDRTILLGRRQKERSLFLS